MANYKALNLFLFLKIGVIFQWSQNLTNNSAIYERNIEIRHLTTRDTTKPKKKERYLRPLTLAPSNYWCDPLTGHFRFGRFFPVIPPPHLAFRVETESWKGRLTGHIVVR